MLKSKRTLLISCAVISLCLCTVVGMTFALFTDNDEISNHLRAGTLDISLTRTSLAYNYLDGEGFLVDETAYVDKEADFTSASKNNLLGIDAEGMKIVPGVYFDADLKIENTGDVAFDYSITIVAKNVTEALASQILVTVTHPTEYATTNNIANGKTQFLLSELRSKNMTIDAGQMSADDDFQAFSIRLDFLDSDTVAGAEHGVTDNNLAKNTAASFDIIVNATQATEKK